MCQPGYTVPGPKRPDEHTGRAGAQGKSSSVGCPQSGV